MSTTPGEDKPELSHDLASERPKPIPTSADIGADSKQFSRKAAKYLVILSALFIIGIAVLAVVYREELRDFQEYGYLGAFVISIMSGGTIVVPVPGIPIIFTLGGILTFPFLVGLLAGLGEGLGAFTFYFAGRGGNSFLPEKHKHNRFYTRIQRWMTQRGVLTLFLASAIFNPAFALVGATAGAMRMPAWKFFVACAAGKAVKGTYVAYLGALGLGHILEWFGMELTP